MALMKIIEKKIANLYKDTPKLDKKSANALAKALPYLAVIAGIAQLVAAWGLWGLTKWATKSAYISVYYLPQANKVLSPSELSIIYISISLLLIEALLLIGAYRPLKSRLKKAWSVLFGVATLNIIYSVLQLFIANQGVKGFAWSLIATALAFYLLLQTRNKFAKK